MLEHVAESNSFKMTVFQTVYLSYDCQIFFKLNKSALIFLSIFISFVDRSNKYWEIIA